MSPHSRTTTRPLRHLACAACLLAAAGCKQSQDTTPADLGPTAGDHGWRPDQDATPRLFVHNISPHHLTSGRKTDEDIDLDISPMGNLALLGNAVVESQMNQALSVMALPAKTKVSGKLTFVDLTAANIDAHFVPDAPLTMDTEYLVHVKPLGYVVPVREHTSFHVGPLPRVRWVRFNAVEGKPAELDMFSIRFSEYVSTAKVAAATTVVDVGKGSAVALTLFNTNKESSGIGLRVPPGTSMTSKLRITVTQDVGALSGLALDGTYSGTPGSGDFTAEIVPAQHVDTPWEPPLTWP